MKNYNYDDQTETLTVTSQKEKIARVSCPHCKAQGLYRRRIDRRIVNTFCCHCGKEFKYDQQYYFHNSQLLSIKELKAKLKRLS